MLNHVGYHKTGSTWPQQHAFTDAHGFTTAMGVPGQLIGEDIVAPPVFERLSTRALDLRLDAGSDCPTERLLNFVLLDSGDKQLRAQLSRNLIRKLDLQVIEAKLVSEKSAPFYDPELVVYALLSLT